MIGHPQREGFGTVTPYLMVRHVDPVVEFLVAAFDATETFRTTGAAGGNHVEVEIGDSKIMLGGDTPGGTDPVPTVLFLYVQDTDSVYESALDAGAQSMIEPGENFDEARGAGVRDPFGNQWFIASSSIRGA
jgi:uncharacterized glyoxalase superfamily protein PhnB